LLPNFRPGFFRGGRINQQKEATMASASKKQTAREQGFPEPYLGKAGNFKPGYDARAKSDLVAVLRGTPNPDALHRFTKAKAQKLIAARSWQRFVAKGSK
jgi:hypothetical protein